MGVLRLLAGGQKTRLVRFIRDTAEWSTGPVHHLVDIPDLWWDDQGLKLHCCEISLICAMLGIHLSDSQQAEQ